MVAAKSKLLKASEAAHVLDKNSRTIVKIMELMEASQKGQKNGLNDEALMRIKQRIDKLKLRMNRRLHKIAKWSDTPVEQRLAIQKKAPIMPRSSSVNSTINATRQLSVSSSYGSFATAAGSAAFGNTIVLPSRLPHQMPPK